MLRGSISLLSFISATSSYKRVEIVKQKQWQRYKTRSYLPRLRHYKGVANLVPRVLSLPRGRERTLGARLGRSQGVLGCPWPPPPFVSNVLSKQLTTGGKNDMKMWWVTSFCHRVIPPLKNPGCAPALSILLDTKLVVNNGKRRLKLRKLRNWKQRQIYYPRLKWVAPDKLVKYSLF